MLAKTDFFFIEILVYHACKICVTLQHITEAYSTYLWKNEYSFGKGKLYVSKGWVYVLDPWSCDTWSTNIQTFTTKYLSLALAKERALRFTLHIRLGIQIFKSVESIGF